MKKFVIFSFIFGAICFLFFQISAATKLLILPTTTSTFESITLTPTELTGSAAIISQELHDGSNDSPIGDIGGSSYRTAQSFLLNTEATITDFDFWIPSKYGNPTGAITLRIETDNAGIPSGNLANANATGSKSSPTENSWNKITFATSFILNASTTYWAILDDPTDPNNNCYFWGYASSNVYADGVQKVETDGGWGGAANDTAFILYGATGGQANTGEIRFSGNNFWGYNGANWVQLDN